METKSKIDYSRIESSLLLEYEYTRLMSHFWSRARGGFSRMHVILEQNRLVKIPIILWISF